MARSLPLPELTLDTEALRPWRAPLIEVQHLTKRYGRVTAVDDLTFRVERGEILGFLGPNGAGKTTTMRILTGYMPATEGKAVVAGFDVFDQPIEAKRRTGYLPETPPLYPEMTVREYLQFVARIKIKGVSSSERRSRVEDSMRRTRVDDMANRHCGKLSKGYRQRVGLAQAILHNPEVLILDEPTAGLDPKQIIETRQLIKELGRHAHDHPEHAHPAGSLADLRSRRHHQQGPGGGGRHAGQPHRPAARLGNDVRAGRRAGPGRRGACCRRVPGVTGVSVVDTHDGVVGYEVSSEKGRDIRRELARAIVVAELGPARAAADRG